ncbi:MAG: hypothetical protein ACPGVY_13355, partial [Mycobacterium sp.]
RSSWLNFPKSLMLMIFAPIIAFGAKYWVFNGETTGENERTGSLFGAALVVGCHCESFPNWFGVTMSGSV